MYINIDAERVRAKMTQADLAQFLGVERKTLYNWQTKGNIPATALIKLADKFGCTTDYLLGRTEDRR